MLIQGKAESKWGVISDCKLSGSSKYLKRIKNRGRRKIKNHISKKALGIRVMRSSTSSFPGAGIPE